MTNNRGYQQVPLNHQEEHERTDLEYTFDIDDDEQHQLLPHSSESQAISLMPIHQQSTDGVFSNIAAKPESGDKTENELPSYEEASADTTPPYWQTTVIAPIGMDDVILVEGLPVGSILIFLWNLTVSASFQFVGFMLTYLLHTTHAAKNGAFAGLGFSLLQYGFYVRSRGTLDEDFDYDGEGHETIGHDATQAKITAYIMMFVGWFIILRALSDFNKARKMERIITSEPTIDDVV